MSSFGELLCGKDGQPAAVACPARRRKYVYQKTSIEATISHGERVLAALIRVQGQSRADDIISAILQSGSQPRGDGGGMDVDASRRRVPRMQWGFWRRFFKEEMGVQHTRSRERLARKALKHVVSTLFGWDTLAKSSLTNFSVSPNIVH